VPLINSLVLFTLLYTSFSYVYQQFFPEKLTTFEQKVLSLPETTKTIVNKRDIVLSNTSGLRLYKDQPYTGQVATYYASGQIAKLSDYQSGLRHGSLQQWFNDGTLGFKAEYIDGILHGASKSWWGNGRLRSSSYFHQGKVHGESMQWYASGEMFKKMNYKHGKEVGLQQAWRRNGKLFSNYEYVNGRIFGLKRANMCVELKDEIIFEQP
jgi:antitoxin component YwqK of YwqJK toxin-antitoxin module